MAVEQSTYLLFVTGFLGGFSTFSTAINEMVSLARNGRFAMAGWYLLATVVVPIVCVALGWMVGSAGAEQDAGIWRAVFPRLNLYA